jgi:hypothetical protein
VAGRGALRAAAAKAPGALSGNTARRCRRRVIVCRAPTCERPCTEGRAGAAFTGVQPLHRFLCLCCWTARRRPLSAHAGARVAVPLPSPLPRTPARGCTEPEADASGTEVPGRRCASEEMRARSVCGPSAGFLAHASEEVSAREAERGLGFARRVAAGRLTVCECAI